MLRFVLSVIVLATLAVTVAAGEGKVALKTEIPEEMLVGTPPETLALLYPELEKPSKDGPPTLMVPKGTVNLALNKEVTSTDARPIIGELKYVTDGRKQGTEDTYVELSPGAQWVQIDLGAPSVVHAVYVWHFFREARSYADVVVQVAEDKEFTKNVRTVYNNDVDNSLKLGIGKDRPYIETNFGKLIDAKGATGQFVRLHSNGNTLTDLNHYVEVEVFGQPAAGSR